MRAARPPIFYKQQDSIKRQLAAWNEASLRAQLDRVTQAELQMKETGFPAETICRQTLLAVAATAGSQGVRASPRGRA